MKSVLHSSEATVAEGCNSTILRPAAAVQVIVLQTVDRMEWSRNRTFTGLSFLISRVSLKLNLKNGCLPSFAAWGDTFSESTECVKDTILTWHAAKYSLTMSWMLIFFNKAASSDAFKGELGFSFQNNNELRWEKVISEVRCSSKTLHCCIVTIKKSFSHVFISKSRTFRHSVQFLSEMTFLAF